MDCFCLFSLFDFSVRVILCRLKSLFYRVREVLSGFRQDRNKSQALPCLPDCTPVLFLAIVECIENSLKSDDDT